MSDEWKQRYIAGWISIAPNIAGTPKALLCIIGLCSDDVGRQLRDILCFASKFPSGVSNLGKHVLAVAFGKSL